MKAAIWLYGQSPFFSAAFEAAAFAAAAAFVALLIGAPDGVHRQPVRDLKIQKPSATWHPRVSEGIQDNGILGV